VNQKWFGDGTEIVTDEGKLYLDTVLDVSSRRIVGFGLSAHHDAELACGALQMAVAVRGGRAAITGVIFHSDQGSEGGFQWSSQHLDNGGVLGWDDGRVRQRYRWAVGGSGLRIGRYGRRCVHRGGRSPRVLCSVRSGV
jgi:hypothetical protein